VAEDERTVENCADTLSLSSGTCFPATIFDGVFWEDPDISLAVDFEKFGCRSMQLRSVKRQRSDNKANEHDES
jgi:hypothetical protein